MIRVDLITGFLGSGKTTFLKRYARWLLEQGQKIGILVNDHGAVNVDMMLLQDLEGENCDLHMIAGGCDPDCHKRRFKTKLISMGMVGYDRVLIEPSGIFDMDEYFDVLHEEPISQWYEAGNVLAIVDADLPNDLSDQAGYYLASQIAGAGKIIFSKVQETDHEKVLGTAAYLNEAMRQVGCSRSFSPQDLVIKDWDKLTGEDFKDILASGYRNESYVKLSGSGEDGYSTLYYMNEEIDTLQLKSFIRAIMEDPSCGHVVRVKGFVEEKPNQKPGMNHGSRWFQINATRQKITVSPISQGQRVFIVIGEKLNQDRIKDYLSSY